jgi:hypothetical protein
MPAGTGGPATDVTAAGGIRPGPLGAEVGAADIGGCRPAAGMLTADVETTGGVGELLPPPGEGPPGLALGGCCGGPVVGGGVYTGPPGPMGDLSMVGLPCTAITI